MKQRSGFFVIDKAPGISSAYAIAQLKRKLAIEKIGHAGTLDPFATGILVVLCNRATKLASVVSGGSKRYRTVFRFGVATQSDDWTGIPLQVSSVVPTLAEIEGVLPKFVGKIKQRPPRVSAVKINGKRAYKRARANEDFETKEKEIDVAHIEIHRYDAPDIELSISCGSGTYIRSIARDLGETLGTCATVVSLRRELNAPFSLEQAVHVESASLGQMVSWDAVFPGLLRVEVSEAQAAGLERGDERVVAQLERESLPKQAQIGERIIFQLAGKNASLGLLEFTGREWKLWAYLGE